MKKMVYQQPTTTIVVVEHMQMLAASGQATEPKAIRNNYDGSENSQTWGSAGVKANGSYVNWDQE